MDDIVETLNQKPRGGTSPYAEALIRLMKRLKECGGNLQKMMNGDPKLAKVVADVCVTRWMPSTNRRAFLVLQPSVEIQALSPMPEPQKIKERAELLAALRFHAGTLNPEWDKLTGPCARCGNYYIKKRESQKVYCSRRCGNTATAVARTRERLDEEHADKLRRSQAAMQKWPTARTKDDWKAFVSKQRELEISRKFLTRAVTKGELTAKGKLTAQGKTFVKEHLQRKAGKS
ncbi:MAG: hypothetical protein ABSC64_12790 [Candidatus Korobacteraceae bacterium]